MYFEKPGALFTKLGQPDFLVFDRALTNEGRVHNTMISYHEKNSIYFILRLLTD